jgi:hypothetical protein
MTTAEMSLHLEKPVNDSTAPTSLLRLVRWYFSSEQMVSFCLITGGLAFFLFGLYLAFFGNRSPYYDGVGFGLLPAGWITLLRGILLNFKSQRHYVVAWHVLTDKMELADGNMLNAGNTRTLYFKKQSIWLTAILVILLLLLHASIDPFWRGCIHTIIFVSVMNLICYEYRSYTFITYWQRVQQELNK